EVHDPSGTTGQHAVHDAKLRLEPKFLSSTRGVVRRRTIEVRDNRAGRAIDGLHARLHAVEVAHGQVPGRRRKSLETWIEHPHREVQWASVRQRARARER